MANYFTSEEPSIYNGVRRVSSVIVRNLNSHVQRDEGRPYLTSYKLTQMSVRLECNMGNHKTPGRKQAVSYPTSVLAMVFWI